MCEGGVSTMIIIIIIVVTGTLQSPPPSSDHSRDRAANGKAWRSRGPGVASPVVL